MSSPIIGTYTNTSLGARLTITSANDSTGGISGTLQINGKSFQVEGIWNTSTMTPNAVFMFNGSVGSPVTIVSGCGASTNYQTFANTNISIAVAETGGVVTTLHGQFIRS